MLPRRVARGLPFSFCGRVQQVALGSTTAVPMEEYIARKDKEYKEDMAKISLFHSETQWSTAQKQRFVKVFYHLRGHFHDFLWIMGNFAPDKKCKDVILHNISEEFGGSRNSHEILYMNFAKSQGVDLISEMISEENYVDYARKFNKEHLQWLLSHNWNAKQAAFSAYERLDNIDYPYLLQTAKSNFKVTDNKALAFFFVHTKVEHFDATQDLLQEIWESDPRSIQEAFSFIYSHQLQMWKTLATDVLGKE